MANENKVPDWLEGIIDTAGTIPSGANGFIAGAHTVNIGIAEAAKDNKDREIIRVTVIGPNDEEGEATLWLHTEGGAKMAVAKVLGILVHNTAEEKKDTIRDFGKRVFANVKEPVDVKEGLMRILNEKLMGKEAFIFADPQGKYNTTKYVDLWHYDQSNRQASGGDQDNRIDNVDSDAEDDGDDPFND